MTTTQALGTVAVGYDGTLHSDVALAWAVRHAAAVGRPLLVIHAVGVPVSAFQVGYGISEDRSSLRMAGRAVLDHGLAKAQALDRGVELREHLALGPARDVLRDAAVGAQLLVLGSRGHGGVAAYVLGSVGAGVAAMAPCPVVVARSPEHADPTSPYADQVVLGLDGTEMSQQALAHAFEYASWAQLPLSVLHCWDEAGTWRDLSSYPVVAEASTSHDVSVAESLAGFGEKYPDVAVRVHQEADEPGHALVRASRDAELVVVGSRGRHDTAALLLGSVSRFVLERAHCPVMVVPLTALT